MQRALRSWRGIRISTSAALGKIAKVAAYAEERPRGMRPDDISFWLPRRCLREPIPEISEAEPFWTKQQTRT
jgi:hypothetical protein